MRNLWIFLSKYSAFFFFIIFFAISMVILIRNNSYQKAAVLNSSNRIIGEAYENVNSLKSYLMLGAVNDSLAAENARLRAELENAFFDDSLIQRTIKDTVNKQQYTYIEAKVVNNSIHQKNNYITINRGKMHGVEKGMGVIGPTGIVGMVLNVSKHYAVVQSLLHTDTRVSASLAGSNVFGSLVWGDDNYDPQLASLKDIPAHVVVKKGQEVVTSGFSLFPHGIPIGKVAAAGIETGGSFLDIKVKLAVDFAALSYVYVVKNSLSYEKQQLEAQSKKEEQ